jgi:hypothetical protein
MSEGPGALRSNTGRSTTRKPGRRVSKSVVAKAKGITKRGRLAVSTSKKRLAGAGLTGGGVTGNRLKRTTRGKTGRRRLGQALQLRRAGVKRVSSTKKGRTKQIVRTARRQGAAK